MIPWFPPILEGFKGIKGKGRKLIWIGGEIKWGVDAQEAIGLLLR